MAKHAIRIAITLLLIGVIVFAVDLGRVVELLLQIDPWASVLVFLLVCIQVDLSTTRWSLAIEALNGRLPHHKLLSYTYMGLFAGLVLPTAIGAAAVKAWLANRDGVSAADAIASVVVDRLLATASLAALAGAALPVLAWSSLPADTVRDLNIVYVILAVAAIAGVVFIIGVRMSRAHLATVPIIGRAADYLANVGRRILAPRFLVRGCVVSLLCQVMMIAAIYVLTQSARLPVTLVDCMILVPPVMLATALPISIGGWGVREGAMVIAFGLVGVSAEAALAVSIQFAVIGALNSLIGAVGWYRTIDAKAVAQMRRFKTT